jgi:hypothetical protein
MDKELLKTLVEAKRMAIINQEYNYVAHIRCLERFLEKKINSDWVEKILNEAIDRR